MSTGGVGTPAARSWGRCGCGADGAITFENRFWCALCALFVLGDAPADAWVRLDRGVGRARAWGRRLEVAA